MLNQFILGGNVGLILKKAEGKQPFSFTCCYTRRYQKDGEWQTRSEWFTVSYFGRGKEDYAEKIAVGDYLEIVGEINNYEYTDKEGNVKRGIYVNANYIYKPNAGISKKQEIKEEEDAEDDGTDDLPF